jgi:hypothetical protein
VTVPDPKALARLDEAIETFRRLAVRAVAAAGGRDVVLADQARHEATFALAAVGLAFKQALKEPGSERPRA